VREIRQTGETKTSVYEAMKLLLLT